jgi:hypothetical protein
MKIKILFVTLLPLSLSTAGHAQTLDKAKLDQFFDRLAEKNKGVSHLFYGPRADGGDSGP